MSCSHRRSAAVAGFADVREGDIFLTPPARAFADGDVQARKVLFAEHLLRACAAWPR